MAETEKNQQPKRTLIDAGVFIGALLKAEPRHDPEEAKQAILLLVESPSAITVINEGLDVAVKTLELAAQHKLTARRIHDARHAAAALRAGIVSVYTYDANDWKIFEPDGLKIIGPPTTLARP